jgi:hypothetical protein
MFMNGRENIQNYLANHKGLTPQEINDLFPEPTHFIDGEPIPDGYFEKLNLFMQGLDEITELDEYPSLEYDGD